MMKIILVNGSPNLKGCTYTGLEEIQFALLEEGIDSEIFQLGKKPLSGCVACGSCKTTKHCGLKSDEVVNDFLKKAASADGFIFGAPVHYAGINGSMKSFLDRVFFAGSGGFRGKPGAAIVSARRGGTTAAFDDLNKFFTISEMPIVSSQYWNMIHGNTPEQVKEDHEGLQTMRTLGKNMGWLLKSIDAGKKAGIELPEKEERQWTNFIR